MNLKVNNIHKLKVGDRVENDIGQKGTVTSFDIVRDGGSCRIVVVFDTGTTVTFWRHHGANTNI